MLWLWESRLNTHYVSVSAQQGEVLFRESSRPQHSSHLMTSSLAIGSIPLCLLCLQRSHWILRGGNYDDDEKQGKGKNGETQESQYVHVRYSRSDSFVSSLTGIQKYVWWTLSEATLSMLTKTNMCCNSYNIYQIAPQRRDSLLMLTL